jgi:hypothetical protein
LHKVFSGEKVVSFRRKYQNEEEDEGMEDEEGDEGAGGVHLPSGLKT